MPDPIFLTRKQAIERLGVPETTKTIGTGTKDVGEVSGEE